MPAGFERYIDRMAAEPPAEASQPWPEVAIVDREGSERHGTLY
jgi:hypothetical protein